VSRAGQRGRARIDRLDPRQQGVIAEGFVSTQAQHGLIHSGAIPFAVLAILHAPVEEPPASQHRRRQSAGAGRLGGTGKQRQAGATKLRHALPHFAVGVMGAAAVNAGVGRQIGRETPSCSQVVRSRVWSEQTRPQLSIGSGWRAEALG